jgi:hypothetical protein
VKESGGTLGSRSDLKMRGFAQIGMIGTGVKKAAGRGEKTRKGNVPVAPPQVTLFVQLRGTGSGYEAGIGG